MEPELNDERLSKASHVEEEGKTQIQQTAPANHPQESLVTAA
jgi:hypothetical protein